MVRISVAMATYNGSKYLRAQLDSLAAQSHLPHELHVGDDGSSDDTLAILDDFARHAPFPVVVRRNPEKYQFPENFLRTAYRCTGDWIAFCDQDDVWLPEKLAACAEAIAASGPDLRLVAHNAMIVREDLTPIHLKTYWRGRVLKPRFALPVTWRCAGFTIACHRSLIDLMPYESGQRLRAAQSYSHDHWIPLLALALGSIFLIGAPLALYRRHDANASSLWELEPRNRRGEVARALRNNGPFYAEQCALAAQAAGIMRASAEATSSPAAAVLLAEAADKAAVQARRLGIRAAIYKGGALAGLRGIASLLAARGYAPGEPYGFGPRAFFKDLAFALLPRGRRSEMKAARP